MPDKISILLPNLRGGGAERVMVNLANALVQRGHLVDMVLLSATGEFLSDLDSRINVVDLNISRIRWLLFPLARYFRKANPAALLACMWPLTVIAQWARTLARSRARLVVAEHITISKSEISHSPVTRWIARTSMHWTFPFVDQVLTVSNGASDDLASFANIDRSSIATVYNPVVDKINFVAYEPCNPIEWWCGQHRRLIAVGSFKQQKNFALLITAFSQLLETVNAKLLILGEGELREEITKQADSLGVSKNLFMPGFIDNPAPYFQHAELFILSSDWEGLSTVIIESLAAGTPVVSTDCPSGPREILADGKYGRLVPVSDATALTAAITQSLTATHDTAALQRRAQDFSIDKAVVQYEDLLFDRG